jgi:hypothetical protein
MHFFIGLEQCDLWKISSTAYFPAYFIIILWALIGSIYANKMAILDWSKVAMIGAA